VRSYLSYHISVCSSELYFAVGWLVVEPHTQIVMADVAKGHIPSRNNKDQSAEEYEYDSASIKSDETQTGVKNIEAVSQTWTQWSLIAAYLGYVSFFEHVEA
jgi:hypothetical protein